MFPILEVVIFYWHVAGSKNRSTLPRLASIMPRRYMKLLINLNLASTAVMLVPPIKALPKHILKKIYKKDFNKGTMTRMINKYQLSILDELIWAPCPTQILKARCTRTCSLHTRLGETIGRSAQAMDCYFEF